jgi:large subunit ribosomal protein L18Ae
MYKEFRAVSENAAVNLLYSELCGRHHAQRESTTIVRITEVKGNLVKEAKTPELRQYYTSDKKFPLLHKRIRTAEKKHRNILSAKRPNLFV